MKATKKFIKKNKKTLLTAGGLLGALYGGYYLRKKFKSNQPAPQFYFYHKYMQNPEDFDNSYDMVDFVDEYMKGGVPSINYPRTVPQTTPMYSAMEQAAQKSSQPLYKPMTEMQQIIRQYYAIPQIKPFIFTPPGPMQQAIGLHYQPQFVQPPLFPYVKKFPIETSEKYLEKPYVPDERDYSFYSLFNDDEPGAEYYFYYFNILKQSGFQRDEKLPYRAEYMRHYKPSAEMNREERSIFGYPSKSIIYYYQEIFYKQEPKVPYLKRLQQKIFYIKTKYSKFFNEASKAELKANDYQVFYQLERERKALMAEIDLEIVHEQQKIFSPYIEMVLEKNPMKIVNFTKYITLKRALSNVRHKLNNALIIPSTVLYNQIVPRLSGVIPALRNIFRVNIGQPVMQTRFIFTNNAYLKKILSVFKLPEKCLIVVGEPKIQQRKPLSLKEEEFFDFEENDEDDDEFKEFPSEPSNWVTEYTPTSTVIVTQISPYIMQELYYKIENVSEDNPLEVHIVMEETVDNQKLMTENEQRFKIMFAKDRELTLLKSLYDLDGRTDITPEAATKIFDSLILKHVDVHELYALDAPLKYIADKVTHLIQIMRDNYFFKKQESKIADYLKLEKKRKEEEYKIEFQEKYNYVYSLTAEKKLYAEISVDLKAINYRKRFYPTVEENVTKIPLTEAYPFNLNIITQVHYHVEHILNTLLKLQFGYNQINFYNESVKQISPMTYGLIEEIETQLRTAYGWKRGLKPEHIVAFRELTDALSRFYTNKYRIPLYGRLRELHDALVTIEKKQLKK